MVSTDYSVDDMLIVEHPFFRLPLDKLRMQLKNQQRLCERGISYCGGVVDDILRRDRSTYKDDSEACSMASQRATLGVTSAVARIHELQEKLRAISDSSQDHLATLKERSKHVGQLVEGSCDFEKWCDTRLNRFLVDYALRNGWLEIAKALAEAKNVSVSLFLTVIG